MRTLILVLALSGCATAQPQGDRVDPGQCTFARDLVADIIRDSAYVLLRHALITDF